jgi:opacity protein-like surface antigen
MKKILIALVLLVIAGVSAYYYSVASQHPDPLKSDDYIAVSSVQLYADFEKDEVAATKKYADKTLKVDGIVTKIELNEERYTLYLNTNNEMGNVICEMNVSENEKLLPIISQPKQIEVYGTCNGFLMDVQMNKCKVGKIIDIK